MENPRHLFIHYLFRAVILFGFAFLISQLVKSNDIMYYIAPRMLIYVKWSAVVLFAVAVYQLFVALQALAGKLEICACQPIPPRSFIVNGAIYGLFVFPLLLGFLLPHVSLGSAMAAKKGVNLHSSSQIRTTNEALTLSREARIQTAAIAPLASIESLPLPSAGQQQSPEQVTELPNSPSQSVDEDIAKLFEHDRFTEHYAKYAMQLYMAPVIQIPEEFFIEALTSIDLYLDSFVGKEMELTGFIFRNEFMSSNQLVVARFAMQCCAADAEPYGILINFDRASSYKEDEWITVTGTINKTVFNDFEILQLDIKKVERAKQPGSPYVYINYDFGL
jgi:uncharacterized repeat protein (TIGR03943 family)